MQIFRCHRALLRVFLAAVSTAQLAGCSLLGGGGTEAPEVRVVDLELVQVGVFEQDYRVTLRLRNPNDTAIPIDGIKFALEINERPFAVGMSSSAVEIPRLGEATIDVRATTSTLDLLGQAMRAGEADALRYKLSGTVYVARRLFRRLRFEREGTVAAIGADRSLQLAPTTTQ